MYTLRFVDVNNNLKQKKQKIQLHPRKLKLNPNFDDKKRGYDNFWFHVAVRGCILNEF